MDKNVDDTICVSTESLGFCIAFSIVMSLCSIAMLVFVIREYFQYKQKRDSLHRKVVNVEEVPKYQGQILDISENVSDIQPAVNDFKFTTKQNKYSLTGLAGEFKSTHDDIEDLDTPGKNSELQNKDAIKDHIEKLIKIKPDNIKLTPSQAKAESSYSIISIKRNEKEESELPSQQHSYSKMVNKNPQIRPKEYAHLEEHDQSPYSKRDQKLNKNE